jgi:transposase
VIQIELLVKDMNLSFPTKLTKMNDRISVLRINDTAFYYKNNDLIFTHRSNDIIAFRFIICQFVVSHLAKQTEIAKFFDISKNSISDWIKDYEEEGAKSFYGIKNKYVHLWSILMENPQCASRDALQILADRGIILSISLRQVNRLRVEWGLNRTKGRPQGLKTRLINKTRSQEPTPKMENIIGQAISMKKHVMRKIYL